MNKLISVIVPIYNVEEYLRQCLDSIINQTYNNLEIILVNDWSTDNSGKICDEYAQKDKRIKVIHQENADLSAARNSGLKISTWEYIAYIDSDDYVDLSMYEKLYWLIESTKADIAICNWRFQRKDWIRIENTIFPNKKVITPIEALEYFHYHMYVRNKLYRRTVVKDLLFVETFAQDVIYNFNIFKKIKKIACLNECMNYYRYNPNSRQHAKKFRKDRLIFLEQWINQEILYAKENKLPKLEKLLIDARYGILLKWFRVIAGENKIDMKIVNKLLRYVRKDLLQFLKSKRSIVKKLFILLSCVNFKFACLIYRVINRFIKIP